MTPAEILDTLIQTHTTEIYLRSGQRNVYVRELQKLLNTLGFGRELNFNLFGATGFYEQGTIEAVRNFSRRTGFPSDGRQVTEVMLRSMIDAVNRSSNPFQPSRPTPPPSPPEPTPREPAGGKSLQMRDEGERFWVSDGQDQVRLFKRGQGFAYWGSITIQQCVDRNRQLLQRLGLSNSALNVIKSVSENEGKLDAINSHDRAFFSFGIFQWTLGFQPGEGELPALLKKVKTSYPAAFRQYFGSHGIDIHFSTNDRTGLLTLHGNPVDQLHEKEAFRKPEWAFYFWKAGQQPQVQAVQIDHALSRLQTFYWNSGPQNAIRGIPLSNIITSEYGVALLLDNHVNRPAYVRPCVQLAMERTGLLDPFRWSTFEERQVLDAYLDIRKTYSSGSSGPMTDAANRAMKTRRYLEQGIISDQRGSFRFTPQMG